MLQQLRQRCTLRYMCWMWCSEVVVGCSFSQHSVHRNILVEFVSVYINAEYSAAYVCDARFCDRVRCVLLYDHVVRAVCHYYTIGGLARKYSVCKLL